MEPVQSSETMEPVDRIETYGDTSVLVCSPTGPVLATEADALDLVGTASWQGQTWVILPATRLSDDFFRLSTRLAGAITQKFVTYRVGLAVTGDIGVHTTASSALRDLVRESNRGRHLWFLADEQAVRARLERPVP